MLVVVAILVTIEEIVSLAMGVLPRIWHQLLPSIRGHVHPHTARLLVANNGTYRQYLQSRFSIISRVVGGIGGDIPADNLGIATAGMGGD